MSKSYQDRVEFASESFKSLEKFVRDAQEKEPGDRDNFQDFERDFHALVMAFEAEVVGKQLQRYDVEANHIEVHGERYRRKGEFDNSYQGLAGNFTIKRALYVPCSGRGRGVVPLELRAGIVEGTWTPLLAQVMARAVASTTPKDASELFEHFGGATPSTSSLDRLPKQLSETWENQREFFEDELRCEETVPDQAAAVAVSLDGVLIPMKSELETDSDKPAGKKWGKGPTDYQEASCGTVSFYNAEGDRLETIRFARAPEHKKKTLKSQLEAELESIYATRPDLRLVCLSDGAADHWEFLFGLAERLGVEHSCNAADLFHVLERVKKALDAYHGEGTPETRAAFAELRIILREKADGADRVLRALRYRRDRCLGTKRKTIIEQIKYIENRKRDGLLRYKNLLDENLPVGSGVVEAACKTLASQRLKLSGMSWRPKGAQAILTFRSLVQSNRWSRAWKMISDQYRVPVTLLEGAA